ncbi:MAG: hypothetical protein HYV63_22285 [Candidatus Schekmanbacteria bacterium]|nr:hypothetical protein [Candidatus Schekmanbacteria bacterium]
MRGLGRSVSATWVVLLAASAAGAGVLGSDWHVDADGDGVATAADRCPYVYDPGQADSDGDGRGDLCDPDFAPPVLDGPVTDLRAQNVTPYGGWFAFSSPRSEEYGWQAVLAWSTDANELAGAASFQQLIDRGSSVEAQVDAPFGREIREPMIVTALTPSTTYYAAIGRITWEGLQSDIGNIIAFTTLPDPQPQPAATRPRVWATSEVIDTLKQRRGAGDSTWATWEPLLASRVEQAVEDPDSVYRADDYCATAALLYLVTGEAAYRDAAAFFMGRLITYWETVEWGGNSYRWADAQLAICLDLSWDAVDAATRERAATTLVAADEWRLYIAPLRMADTDEYTSSVRTWIVDGLVLCGASGLPAALEERACTILDAGLRGWYGVQLVKARRDRGFFAESGGYLPDGSDYGQGTTSYWLHTAWALANAGISPAENSGFFLHNLLVYFFYSLSPRQRGFVTMGDVEDFSYNYGVEPSSFQLEAVDATVLAFHQGLLGRAGLTTEAGWARRMQRALYPPAASPEAIAMLLFDTDQIPERDHRDTLATAFLDSGFGVFFDRSSWSAQASSLFFQSGWRYVDHRHADSGHFQLYRAGRWITHEAIGYDGPAAQDRGHNIPLLQIADESGGGGDHVGQYLYDPIGNIIRLLGASSGAYHAFSVADMTGAYGSFRQHSENYDRVQRALFWLKTDEAGAPDVVVVYDVIDAGAQAPATLERRIQLHFDAAPVIDAPHATVLLPGETPQRVEVSVLAPADATLSAQVPEGEPDTYPGPLYTHRLVAAANASTAAAPKLRFVTVLSAQDIGAPAPAVPRTAAGADWRVVVSGSDAVVLPEAGWEEDGSGDAGAGAEVSVTIDAAPPLRVWITALAPLGTYAVTAAPSGDGGGGTLLTLAPGGGPRADSFGVLAISVAADYTVAPLYPDVAAPAVGVVPAALLMAGVAGLAGAVNRTRARHTP